MTPAEYFRLEELAGERHDYWDGEIQMNQGGTYQHSTVIANVVGALWSRLRGKPCRVTESNTRVALSAGKRYVYPDAVVVCGDPKYDPSDKRPTTILNPSLVVEVLSTGTEGYDRGKKFDGYRDIETLRQYVLVSTEEPRVETYLRRDDGTWVFSAVSDPEKSVRLHAIDLEIPLAEVYDKVEFEQLPPEGGEQTE